MSREIKFRAWDKETKSMIKEVWEIGLKSNYNQPWLIGDDKRTDNFELMVVFTFQNYLNTRLTSFEEQLNKLEETIEQ